MERDKGGTPFAEGFTNHVNPKQKLLRVNKKFLDLSKRCIHFCLSVFFMKERNQ